MRSFEIDDLNPAQFVEKIRAKLAARDYDRYASLGLDGDRLLVKLRWMGTTRFEYRVTRVGEGFRAELVDQTVATLHRAFGERFESYFEEALTKVGAKLV
jgi:hypothetical protein